MKLTLNHESSKQKIISASQLEIGEMMRVIEKSSYEDHILLRCFKFIISLSDPTLTWSDMCPIQGIKLSPGESVTLTQE